MPSQRFCVRRLDAVVCPECGEPGNLVWRRLPGEGLHVAICPSCQAVHVADGPFDLSLPPQAPDMPAEIRHGVFIVQTVAESKWKECRK